MGYISRNGTLYREYQEGLIIRVKSKSMMALPIRCRRKCRKPYRPKRDYAYLEINRALRRRHPELIEDITYQLLKTGGWVTRSAETDLFTVNGEFTVSLIIARCKPTKTGKYRWCIRFDASLKPDITVVARMDESNKYIYDYYVFPAIDFSPETLPLLEDNGFTLDAYRTDCLDGFYHLAGRVALQEVA